MSIEEDDVYYPLISGLSLADLFQIGLLLVETYALAESNSSNSQKTWFFCVFKGYMPQC